MLRRCGPLGLCSFQVAKVGWDKKLGLSKAEEPKSEKDDVNASSEAVGIQVFITAGDWEDKLIKRNEGRLSMTTQLRMQYPHYTHVLADNVGCLMVPAAKGTLKGR